MAVGEGSGLICGFRLASLAPLRDALPALPTEAEPLWVHVSLTDSRARAWLAQRDELPEEARDLLLGTDARIHVELLPGGVLAVLGDLYHDFDLDPERLGTLRLYLDHRWLAVDRHDYAAADNVDHRHLRHERPRAAVRRAS